MNTFVINSVCYNASTASLSLILKEMIDVENNNSPICFNVQNATYIPTVFRFFDEMEINPLSFTHNKVYSIHLQDHFTTLLNNPQVYLDLVDLPLCKLAELVNTCDYLDIPLLMQLCLLKIATLVKTTNEHGKLMDKSEADVLTLVGKDVIISNEQVLERHSYLKG